jgi:membrane protease YdiL (CAAX protease family)
MQMRTEQRPFGYHGGRPGVLYSREVKAQLRNIVFVLVAYLILQAVASFIIMQVIMLSTGMMDDLLMSMSGAALGGELDFGSLLESTMLSSQDALMKYTDVVTIVSAVVCMPIFLVLRGKRMFTRDITTRYAPLSPRSFLRLWGIAMGAQFVFNVGAAWINSALEQSGQSVTDMMNQSMQMLQTPLGLLYICLVGPIVEELIFRGAIMKSLERFGLNFSIIMSSLIFGLFHIFTVQAVFAFFMGLILGYIASRYSIMWSILAHILINSVSMGLERFGSLGGGAAGEGIFYNIAETILIAFFVCGVILLIVERWRFAEQRRVGAPIRIPGSPERTGAALWRAAFTSIPMLLYIIVTVGLGILMIAAPSFNIPGLMQ